MSTAPTPQPAQLPPPDGCAAASLQRAENLAGTASGLHAFCLIEHDGPWGVDALADTPLPPAVSAWLQQQASSTGVRVLMIRRHRRRRTAAPDRPQVFAAHVRPGATWCRRTTIGSYDDLTGIDLAGIADGRPPADWDDHAGPLFAVCTHGRHDACCARFGRDVAAALAAERPEQTWECSHIGGDRFAPNLLALPAGFYFGRVDPEAVLEVARLLQDGELDLDHVRGRTWYATPVQAAEIGLRRHLDRRAIEEVRLLQRERVSSELTRCRFVVAGAGEWLVEVTTTAGEPAALTCRAQRLNRPPVHTVTAIAEAASG